MHSRCKIDISKDTKKDSMNRTKNTKHRTPRKFKDEVVICPVCNYEIKKYKNRAQN